MKGSESREHRQEYSKLKMVLLYYGTYHNTINDKYHKESSFMKKEESDICTCPVEERASRIRIAVSIPRLSISMNEKTFWRFAGNVSEENPDRG